MLLARELLTLKVEIPMKLATALVYGILSDTLDFYRVAKQETVETYMNLLPYSDVHILARIQNPSRPRKFFGDLSHCIARSQVRQRLIVSHLGQVENPDVISQMADFLLACEGIQWAFCTGRHGENITCVAQNLHLRRGCRGCLARYFQSPQAGGGTRTNCGREAQGGRRPNGRILGRQRSHADRTSRGTITSAQ